jgi:hypothetical protein
VTTVTLRLAFGGPFVVTRAAPKIAWTGAAVKIASTAWAWLIVTWQEPVPLQPAPFQSENWYPVLGVAVSVT